MIQQTSTNLIRNYVRAIFRNRGKLLFFNLLTLLLAVAVLMFWPREYRSEAKVWIKIGRENSKLDPTAATGETIAIQETDREDEIKSIIDIIGSRGVIEKAVEQVGVPVVLGDEPLPGTDDSIKPSKVTAAVKSALGSVVKQIKQIDPISDREEAVQDVLKHIVVDAERKSNVVSVQYDCESPALAQAIVSAVIDQYKEEHTRIHKTEGSKRFFGEQLTTLKDRVKDTSEALRKAKTEMGLASIDGHRAFLENKIAGIGEAELTAAQKLAESQALNRELVTQLSKHPQTIRSEERLVPNTGRDSLSQQLYDLQVERMEMEARHRNHPKLTAIRRQEARAQQELESRNSKDRTETTQAINTVHQALSLEMARVSSQAAGFQAMLSKLSEQKKSVLNEIAKLNQGEIEVNDLQRQVELAVSSYTIYAENLEDARVDEELNLSAISNVSVAQQPTFQEKPVTPSKLAIAALTLAAMLFGSIAIVSGMVMIDDSVSRFEDVAEVLDTPVIISVPNHREFRHVVH